MFSTKIVVFTVLAALAATEGGVVAPALAPVAPVAPVAYTNVIPYNIPPYADSINIVQRAPRVPVAAYAASPVLHATPLAAGVLHAPHAVAPVAHALPAPVGHALPAHALPAPFVPGLGYAAHGLATPLAVGHALPAPFYK